MTVPHSQQRDSEIKMSQLYTNERDGRLGRKSLTSYTCICIDDMHGAELRISEYMENRLWGISRNGVTSVLHTEDGGFDSRMLHSPKSGLISRVRERIGE